VPGPADTAPAVTGPNGETPPGGDDARFAGLDQRPAAEHVAVFEDEHSRLQRELGTIDQL